ncbi:MAG: sulfatase family protein [Thermoguttaceae bacterium]
MSLSRFSCLPLIFLVLLPAALPQAGAAEKPNFVIVMADDATFRDLPLWGGQNVKMPNLDRLASEGLVFDRAYVTMSMCLPCRTELHTGLFPMRSGACWNHSAARPGTRSTCHYLGALGYRLGLAGKSHLVPRSVFPFEMLEGYQRDCVAPTAEHDPSAIREFMSRDPNQPFCLVVALVVPHVVWTVGDPSHFDRKALKLPPNLADLPQTRDDFARYLAEIEYLDLQIGEVLATLDAAGKADETLVLFTSEQGAQFPGCKWTNWDTGVHTGVVVRWPGKVATGRRTEAIIQYADVLPTLIEAAGGTVDAADFDGSSFLPVLLGKKDSHRQYAYGMHNNVPEGPPYPIRSVFDGEFRYIRNLTPEATYIERHIMGVDEHNPYWARWMYMSGENERAYQLIHRYMRRPAEELYRTSQDPYEMTSLADDPFYAEIKARLRAELDRWLKSQGDPGKGLDTKKAWEEIKKAAEEADKAK